MQNRNMASAAIPMNPTDCSRAMSIDNLTYALT